MSAGSADPCGAFSLLFVWLFSLLLTLLHGHNHAHPYSTTLAACRPASASYLLIHPEPNQADLSHAC